LIEFLKAWENVSYRGKKLKRRKMMKTTLILLATLCIVFSFNHFVWAQNASQEQPSAEDLIGDAIWVRPFSVIGMAIEAVAFVISYPVTKSLGWENEAHEFLIKDPYQNTFERPLGIW
jgi:hypothetical protein